MPQQLKQPGPVGPIVQGHAVDYDWPDYANGLTPSTRDTMTLTEVVTRYAEQLQQAHALRQQLESLTAELLGPSPQPPDPDLAEPAGLLSRLSVTVQAMDRELQRIRHAVDGVEHLLGDRA